MGKFIDTFVAAQLRPELQLGDRPANMFHIHQDGGRREVDLVIERTDGAVVAIEIKAAANVNSHDARHLAWLRDQLDSNQFKAGIVFYTGAFVRQLGERLWAVPVCSLWA